MKKFQGYVTMGLLVSVLTMCYFTSHESAMDAVRKISLMAINTTSAAVQTVANTQGNQPQGNQPQINQPQINQIVTQSPEVLEIAPEAHRIGKNDAKNDIDIEQEFTLLHPKTPDLNPKVLKLALLAYHNAAQKNLAKKKLLTIIDYSKPSSEKRLWVINLLEHTIDFHTLVAHGRGSGANKSTKFSNANNSKKSSLGVYLTSNAYVGHKGPAMRLIGLDKGFNTHALKRAVVMHGAKYVSKNFVNAHGRLGRSWGCPAVSKKLAKPIINEIKDGSILFAYYPDKNWLHQSVFLR